MGVVLGGGEIIVTRKLIHDIRLEEMKKEGGTVQRLLPHKDSFRVQWQKIQLGHWIRDVD